VKLETSDGYRLETASLRYQPITRITTGTGGNARTSGNDQGNGLVVHLDRKQVKILRQSRWFSLLNQEGEQRASHERTVGLGLIAGAVLIWAVMAWEARKSSEPGEGAGSGASAATGHGQELEADNKNA